MQLGDKIILQRKNMGLSQESLAEKLGVSRQAVSKWESLISKPEIDKVILMSELFNVTTDYLLIDSIEDCTYNNREKSNVKINLKKENVDSKMNSYKEYKVKNEIDDKEFKTDIKKKFKYLMEIYWLLVTALYFSLSSLTGRWGITWIIWIIAGILSEVVELIYKYKNTCEN